MSDLITDPVELPDSVVHWLAEYKKLQLEKKELEEKMELARAHVELALGQSSLGLHNGQPVVKWGWVESTRFDTTKAKEILRDQPGILQQCMTTSRARRFDIVKDES